jgi:hypothetical protein
MRNLICVLLLCGCGGTAGFTNISSSPRKGVVDKTPDFTVTVQEQILTRQDESIVILKENTNALAAIKSQVESLASETREATDTLKASLISSNPNGKESDPASATEPQELEGKESQPAILAASSPAVRLFVTHAPFHCPPCERLKAAVFNGEFEGFEVTDVGDFSGLRSYPAIRFETPKTTTGWGVVYGYDSSTIPTLRAMTQGTSAPATGAIFPLQTANHVTGSRSSFRSVSRWVGHDRGPRVTTRATFRSGSSP